MHVTPPLYLNALFLLLGDPSERSRTLVKEFTDMADKHASKNEIFGDEDNLIAVYRSLIRTVLTEHISQDNTSATKMLLLKLSTNEVLKQYPLQRDLLTDVLTAADPVTAEQIDEYLKSLRNAILAAEVDTDIKRAFAKSRAIMDIPDTDLQSVEINSLKIMMEGMLKNIEQRESNSGSKASESYVSLNDPESIKRSLDKYVERSVVGIVQTGLQGLNRALGKRGGVGRGETIVFAAPSHHYKSGMLISFLIWTVTYNKPQVQPGKRALIYFVSLENETHENIMQVFRILYGRVERKQVDLVEYTVDRAIEWIISYFKQFDVDVFIDRFTPHEFSFGKFLNRYNFFMELDYELILFDLDYLSEAKGVDPGDTMSAAGHQQLIKENYIKFRNHGNQQGYIFATGHQLNRKADELVGTKRNAVRFFNPSMVADSSDVFRPVDIFFFLLLESNLDGVRFLTGINRKNRGNPDTPEAHKFFAYPFTEFGIEDDLGGPPRYVIDIDTYDPEGGVRTETVADGALF